ncbi:MAG: VacJ family lipoprotein [Pseudoduganella sp.]|jgi:phospholipid-binding lipoprotein MlaA|nr:VacJ family lipoprotein [Pseudoduganella sp.]
MSKFRTLTLTVALAAALSGCATSNNPRDPFEGYNRAVFTFNDKVDEVALKPAATAYKNVTPGFFQTGVSNFFGNLADVWTAANNLLQGKVGDGMSDIMRVALNSTFGLLGVLDIASEAGLQKHKEDFGQTLGSWGVPSGPYLMLPLLGPSTVRDTVALPADIYADPWQYKDPVNVRTIGSVTRVVDQRAALLDASTLLEDAALDRYEFIRDGWMQRRNSQVYDGEDGPPGKQKKAEQADEAPSAPQAIIAEPADKTSSL